jgi:hypothetical protein
MIALSAVFERFAADYLARMQPSPAQRQALAALGHCRTALAATFTAQCSNDSCRAVRVIPHSCGHRLCPHCQHADSQRWIERQRQQLVPGPYFLVTFTLPAELRPLAWAHQRIVYDALMDCAWQTLAQFALNHRQLQGTAGAVAVLHTHSRALELHPHVHLALPAAALDEARRLWRQLPAEQGYLFNHKALAKVFRGKLMDCLKARGLQPPIVLPERWVVDCKRLDHGDSAIVYLGRYLYRGVIQEQDIVRMDDSGVTYRWRHSKSGLMRQRTVSGAEFLRLVLQHVLPKGLRRARSYGFLHPNARRTAALLKLLVFQTPKQKPPAGRATLRCTCCGAPMLIVATRTPPSRAARAAASRRPPTAPPPAHGGPLGAQA